MSQITGKAKRYDGTAVDYVLLFDWLTGECIGTSIPDSAGNWSFDSTVDLNCGITYVSDGCEPITHGSYYFEGSLDITVNNIGEQGSAGFGLGVASSLPLGMYEIDGTRTLGHENYGNYQYGDNSIMVWIPMFYYRWASSDSSRVTIYGLNALDIKSKYDFSSVAEANAAGYAVHRAFYDNGQLKDGFFVDKYLCSNNSSTASSLKNGIPLIANSSFNSVTGVLSNTMGAAIDVVKSRGSEFLVTTIFIQRALSLLSMAHSQAALDNSVCAWYDATGVANFPKGNNNNAFGDFNDNTVGYTSAGLSKLGRTGSAVPFAKTTHNGQLCGIADLNGNAHEVAIGITHLSGAFYALKTTTKASLLTSGNTLSSDAWGVTGIAENYQSLGTSNGALTGVTRSLYIGNGSQQVFSNQLTGLEWQASCAGLPLAAGVSISGSDLFGRDQFYDYRTDNLCPMSGGDWSYKASSGVWCTYLTNGYSSSSNNIGVRAALYVE